MDGGERVESAESRGMQRRAEPVRRLLVEVCASRAAAGVPYQPHTKLQKVSCDDPRAASPVVRVRCRTEIEAALAEAILLCAAQHMQLCTGR